jgi:hypothetical protein
MDCESSNQRSPGLSSSLGVASALAVLAVFAGTSTRAISPREL